MAIEKIGSGAFLDHIKIKGSGVTQSLAGFIKDLDAGGTDAIEETYRGGYQSLVITSGSEMMTLAAFIKYQDGGGTDTISGQLIGGGSNVIVDGGIMKNLVEKQSGQIQVLEEPGISLLEGEGDPENEEDPE